MSVRSISASDLPTLFAWWRDRGEGELPDGILPPVGIVASDAHGPAAAAWIYQPAGVPLAILDWLITRPGLGQHQARHACREVFTALAEAAREDGATRLFATVTRAGMLREARSCGFQVVAQDAVHLIKSL
ncbi:MAG: hypothetical protein EOP88_20945 [Verrucomicrobiaceae bacterium]|nr:MAG: hypothetical protein EOP88_20945 [Verrucomicrobiaceae bacterium]